MAAASAEDAVGEEVDGALEVGGDEEEEGEGKTDAPVHVYMGEFLNGKKHGTGQMSYPNGDVYYGLCQPNYLNQVHRSIYQSLEQLRFDLNYLFATND